MSNRLSVMQRREKRQAVMMGTEQPTATIKEAERPKPPRKTLEKVTPKDYDESRSLVCHFKEVTRAMVDRKPVKGSLCEDKGTWVVRARVYDPTTGKTRLRSKSTGLKTKDSTKRKALQMMEEIVKQWEREANAEVPKADPLFSDYYRKWIDEQTLRLRANSIKSYEDYARVHILPALGDLKIRQLNLQIILHYFKLKLDVLSVDSLKKHKVVITGVIGLAARDGIIPADFTKDVKLPAAKKFEGKAYTVQQVAELLSAAEKEGEPIHAAIILAVCYGLRRSEICGLRWSDIDFDKKVLNVRNTKTQNGALVIEDEHTKTAKSRRTIDLIESTIPYFAELKEQQEQAGFSLGKVCRQTNGKEPRLDYISRRTKQIMKKYDLECIRLHDLRHTAATLLATRATPKQVQSFLGHEDISTTLNTYTHLLETDRKITSGIMDDILKDGVFCSEICSEGNLPES